MLQNKCAQIKMYDFFFFLNLIAFTQYFRGPGQFFELQSGSNSNLDPILENKSSQTGYLWYFNSWISLNFLQRAFLAFYCFLNLHVSLHIIKLFIYVSHRICSLHCFHLILHLDKIRKCLCGTKIKCTGKAIFSAVLNITSLWSNCVIKALRNFMSLSKCPLWIQWLSQ